MANVESILQGRPDSMGALLEWRIQQTPDTEAFRSRNDKGAWVSLTWAQTGEVVHRLAAGLLSLGLGFEQRVAIAAGTRLEWILADFAINAAGGATTTVYPNTTGKDFLHIVSHSDSRILIAENASHLDKLEQSTDLGSQIRHIVIMDGDGDGRRILSWKQLLDRGAQHLAEDPDCVARAIAGTHRDTLATLIYTSGTTGLPKGVELTHENWIYEGFAVDRLRLITADDLQYLWLPLSHVFGKCLLVCQLAIGFATAVDGRLDKIVDGLGETRPTFMCGAPRIYEKVRAAVVTGNSTGVKGRIARWAFAVGRDSQPYRLAGKPLPALLAARYAVADKLVFSKLKARLGGRIKFLVSGSVKLNRQVQGWFYSAGLLIVEGYGLTETTAVTFVNHPDTPRLGTVGPVVPDTQVKIADDGEVLVRGPGVMRGYHQEPALTAEVLVDGWFHTGDIGYLDAEGNLTLTDRKKDLMKTSGGKYVAPQKVEGAVVAAIPYVSQVIAVGDRHKYISAILTMDRDGLQKWGARHGLAGRSYEQLTQSPELRASVQKRINKANTQLERWETVKKFTILDHEFTVDEGGVTPSMKLRRAALTQRYAGVVEAMYEDEGVEPE